MNPNTKLYAGRVNELGFVATVYVPPFNDPPEVVIWGQRVFAHNPSVGEYVEVFAYHAIIDDTRDDVEPKNSLRQTFISNIGKQMNDLMVQRRSALESGDVELARSIEKKITRGKFILRDEPGKSWVEYENGFTISCVFWEDSYDCANQNNLSGKGAA